MPQEQEIMEALRRIENHLARLEKSLPPSGEAEPKALPRRGGAGAAGGTAAPYGNEEETWLELPEDQAVSLMAPFANSQRVKLMKALYLGMNDLNRLKEFTGLSGGQLYHHLKELALAKYLSRQVRGEYKLSSLGYYAFATIMIAAADLCAEETDEELIAPDEIGEME